MSKNSQPNQEEDDIEPVNAHAILYIQGCAEKYIGWHHIFCWWLFGPMSSKHCNADGKSVWGLYED